MWSKARGWATLQALSTDRAGARQRIVHMSIALPGAKRPAPRGLDEFVLQPVRAGTRLNNAERASLSSSAACTSVNAVASS